MAISLRRAAAAFTCLCQPAARARPRQDPRSQGRARFRRDRLQLHRPRRQARLLRQRPARPRSEAMMPKRRAPALLAVLVATSALFVGVHTMLATETTTTTPSLPAAPQPTSRVTQGAPGGSGSYVVSAAANEHASFLWVVDSIQRVVTLCEKADSKDFTCTRKPLP